MEIISDEDRDFVVCLLNRYTRRCHDGGSEPTQPGSGNSGAGARCGCPDGHNHEHHFKLGDFAKQVIKPIRVDVYRKLCPHNTLKHLAGIVEGWLGLDVDTLKISGFVHPNRSQHKQVSWPVVGRVLVGDREALVQADIAAWKDGSAAASASVVTVSYADSSADCFDKRSDKAAMCGCLLPDDEEIRLVRGCRQCGAVENGVRCTMHDNHPGFCSFATKVGARDRKKTEILSVSESMLYSKSYTCDQSETAVSPTSAGATYNTNISKQGHRAMFASCLLGDPHDTRPVVYLDAGDGGFTAHLLSLGVDRTRLRPYNNRLDDCASITKCTSVTCVHKDINDVADDFEEGACTIAWFDMTGTEVKLTEVAHIATFVQITVSTRGEIPDAKLRVLRDVAKSCGLVEQEVAIYRGNGRKMNMIHTLFYNPRPTRRSSSMDKNNLSATSETDVDESTLPQLSRPPLDMPSEWVHTALRVPISRWANASISVDWSLYQTHGGFVDALVVDFKRDTLILAYLTRSGRYLRDTQAIEHRCARITPHTAVHWVITTLGKRRRSKSID